MPIRPTDPNAAITALADSVDKLSGQVAALMAYMAHISAAPLSDRDLAAMKGLAQTSSPPALGSGRAGVPALHAAHAADRLQSMVKHLHTIRR